MSLVLLTYPTGMALACQTKLYDKGLYVRGQGKVDDLLAKGCTIEPLVVMPGDVRDALRTVLDADATEMKLRPAREIVRAWLASLE